MRLSGNLVACAALAAALFACGNDRVTEPCQSDQDFFERKVWGEVLGKVCVRCHTLAGQAAEENAELKLQPPAFPNFLAVNLANMTSVANIQISGVSELLVKPTSPQTSDSGGTTHGGGILFDADSEEYAILQEFVARTANPTTDCADQIDTALDQVVLLDGPHTLRKATLELVGRLPTTAERAAVTDPADLDTALDQVLDQVMTEPAFYDRVSELYNDVFLTDRFITFTGRATNLLDTGDWPNAANTVQQMLPQLDRERTNLAVAREPLELINHVIRNGRPFTEIVTADYTVVNPYSAVIYGTANSFADPTDVKDWQEAKLTVSRMGGPVPWPHTGVLSSPMWLNRFPTTPTNRNRHRASMVYRDFLATDILAIADRAIDTTNLASNPTLNDAQCKVCHTQIDPIAGGFQKWDNNDQEDWNPGLSWFTDMAPPGFEGERTPTSEFDRALPWLGARVAADPRFAVAVTRQVFQGLTGQTPLAYPVPGDPQFEERRRGFVAQDRVLAEIAAAFVDSNFDFRVVVKRVIRSPYFRASNAAGELDVETALVLDGVGTARFVTPERLARKIEAVFGAPWVRGDRKDYLATDFRISYGGIDSDTIVDRLSTPNALMSGVSWRMANEVACLTTAWDFSRPVAERSLFPAIEIADVPEVAGAPSAAGEAKIRAGLVHLHEQVLAETLAPTDPEIDRSYQLWLDTWRDGKAALTGGQATVNMLSACRARNDPRTGLPLPTADQINGDPEYTIRSWMAVVTYLLSDYRFLHS